jgi:hypothetical protein
MVFVPGDGIYSLYLLTHKKIAGFQDLRGCHRVKKPAERWEPSVFLKGFVSIIIILANKALPVILTYWEINVQFLNFWSISFL